jgi:uncharacterized protein (DUF2345 family)
MEQATDDISLYAASNIFIAASNNASLTTKSNLTMGALEGDFKAYADHSNMFLTMEQATDDISLYAASNIFIAASNNASLTTKSNLTMGALEGDFKAYADSSNMFLTMEQATDNISLYAASNIFVTASNNYSLTAKSNLTMGALEGDFKAYADRSNMFLTMSEATDDIALYAASNIFITASNNASLTTKSNLTMGALSGDFKAYANGSNMYMTMDHATNSVNLYASNLLNLTASNSATMRTVEGEMLFWSDSNLKLQANNSNMYISMSAPSDNIDIFASNNMYVTASNDFYMQAKTNAEFIAKNNMNVVAGHDMVITGSNSLTFNTKNMSMVTSEDLNFTARSNISFRLASSVNNSEPVFTVQGSQLLVRGDIVITGSINTSNVYSTSVIQESIKIADKTIILSSTGSNFSAGDGPVDSTSTNSGSGIKIDGVPTGYDSNIPAAYDKTFTWNHGPGNGILDMGTAPGMSNESFWELKGGAFRLTHQKVVNVNGVNTVRDISFGFRVNELDELELVKRYWDNTASSYVVKRIMRFGRVL